MVDYEKLGVFYLGRALDSAGQPAADEPVLYDSRQLTTHAVCVGMTGSGKTGLCLSLLEEAAIDGVPALCIDPKGDLGNLLLTFPALSGSDFLPWVDGGEAERKGLSTEQFAEQTAQTWRKGLEEWDEKPERIQRFRDAVDLAIYTPGSDAGLSLSVLKSFAPPPPESMQDTTALRERVSTVVSGLLALMQREADPLRSREHVLLSNIVENAWRQNKGLELADLVSLVQKPPFEKLGTLDLETFYPAKDRMELAMAINLLLASPGFAAWMTGEAMDIQRLLYTPEGKPRIAIVSIAHLSDAERMFVVTLLLNEMVAWMRRQSGTSSLRAILYMDEILGYFPPTANPPSKQPMLTLLKQARAFGVGCVLATQNPVDLDYKGLSNAGTWLIGRLQTERDKMRIMEGLETALSGSAGFDRGELEKTISNLAPRSFLLRSVHEDAPVLFRSRWALSYLRGPLTSSQISQLMAGRKKSVASSPAPVTMSGSVAAPSQASTAAQAAAVTVGETDSEYQARLALEAREKRDAAVEALRRKYAPKFSTLKERERRAQQAVEKQQSQLSQQKMQTMLSIGASVLGALLGQKRMTSANVNRAASAARSAGRIGRENQDVEQAGETLAAVQQQLRDLEAQFNADCDAIALK